MTDIKTQVVKSASATMEECLYCSFIFRQRNFLVRLNCIDEMPPNANLKHSDCSGGCKSLEVSQISDSLHFIQRSDQHPSPPRALSVIVSSLWATWKIL